MSTAEEEEGNDEAMFTADEVDNTRQLFTAATSDDLQARRRANSASEVGSVSVSSSDSLIFSEGLDIWRFLGEERSLISSTGVEERDEHEHCPIAGF